MIENFRLPPTTNVIRAPVRVQRAPLESTFPHTFPVEERANWLTQYEEREGSIFKYYNVQNEIAFIKNVQTLPPNKKEFYLEENIKRFLGEFVGKIPYSTIPYELDVAGFSYAGMHVGESYKKAAAMGGERERAEVQGFDEIENTYKWVRSQKRPLLPTGVWISPPKIADYGFVFVFAPDAHGTIREYILRYPEKMGELKMSTKIFNALSPTSAPPQSANEFITQPLFDMSGNTSAPHLHTVMKTMGISPSEIQESHQFETKINSTLASWIHSYSSLIASLASYDPSSPYYDLGVQEAKKLLLTIYQKAEEIKNNRDSHENSFYQDIPLSNDELHYAVGALQTTTDLPTTDEGSCPVTTTNSSSSNMFERKRLFRDNLSILINLTRGIPINSTIESDTFDCPKCGYKIPSGKGYDYCPSCNITSAQYAQETGIKCV